MRARSRQNTPTSMAWISVGSTSASSTVRRKSATSLRGISSSVILTLRSSTNTFFGIIEILQRPRFNTAVPNTANGSRAQGARLQTRVGTPGVQFVSEVREHARRCVRTAHYSVCTRAVPKLCRTPHVKLVPQLARRRAEAVQLHSELRHEV